MCTKSNKSWETTYSHSLSQNIIDRQEMQSGQAGICRNSSWNSSTSCIISSICSGVGDIVFLYKHGPVIVYFVYRKSPKRNFCEISWRWSWWKRIEDSRNFLPTRTRSEVKVTLTDLILPSCVLPILVLPCLCCLMLQCFTISYHPSRTIIYRTSRSHRLLPGKLGPGTRWVQRA